MDFFETVITDGAKRRVMECLNSGYVSEGELVKEFEQRIEQEFGYKNCVAVNSGTSALHLALILAGVKAGDEVILPAQTFVATGLAVLYCGAKPVFADIEKETGNISRNGIVDVATKNTKAIIAVSWGGVPCRLDVISELCREWEIACIQDNAQALGATYYGKPLDNWGDFSCFSFQAIKHLTTGDGGMLTCNNYQYTRVHRLRWFGIDKKLDLSDETGERHYNLDELGYKYHMNDYAAALGLGNLEGFQDRLNKRRMIAHFYTDNLPEEILTQWGVGSACWLYTVLVERRSDFMRMMRSKDIPVSVVHNGIQRNDIFGEYKKGSLPVQEYWDEHHVCLPIHSSLTDEDVQKVIKAVQSGW